MNPALVSRFRTFADKWDDDDQVDMSGLTGADLKAIAEHIERPIAMVERMKLGPQ